MQSLRKHLIAITTQLFIYPNEGVKIQTAANVSTACHQTRRKQVKRLLCLIR